MPCLSPVSGVYFLDVPFSAVNICLLVQLLRCIYSVTLWSSSSPATETSPADCQLHVTAETGRINISLQPTERLLLSYTHTLLRSLAHTHTHSNKHVLVLPAWVIVFDPVENPLHPVVQFYEK